MALDPDLAISGHTPQQIRHRLIDRITERGPEATPAVIVDEVVLPYVGQLLREVAEVGGDSDDRLMHVSVRANLDQLADEYENAGEWCRE